MLVKLSLVRETCELRLYEISGKDENPKSVFPKKHNDFLPISQLSMPYPTISSAMAERLSELDDFPGVGQFEAKCQVKGYFSANIYGPLDREMVIHCV